MLQIDDAAALAMSLTCDDTAKQAKKCFPAWNTNIISSSSHCGSLYVQEARQSQLFVFLNRVISN